MPVDSRQLQQGLEAISVALGKLAPGFDDDADSLNTASRLLSVAAQSGLELQALVERLGPGGSWGMPRWLVTAKGELGTAERPGRGKDNPRILDYQAATVHRESGDHIAWCSAYICWLMEQRGIESPRSARARSWLDWGAPLAAPRVGCVAVFWRGRHDDGRRGHVGLWLADDDTRILLHGGNQSNRVSEIWYPKSRLLGYRWPLESSQ